MTQLPPHNTNTDYPDTRRTPTTTHHIIINAIAKRTKNLRTSVYMIFLTVSEVIEEKLRFIVSCHDVMTNCCAVTLRGARLFKIYCVHTMR